MKQLNALHQNMERFFYLALMFFLFLIGLFFPNHLQAQTAAQYPLTITSGTYSSISTTGTYQPDVLISDSAANIMGLSPGFVVNGVSYTNAVMNNNGYLELYNLPYTMPIAYYEQGALSYYPNPIFAPFYMNLGLSSLATTAAYSQTIGSEHIFEWKNFSRLNNGDDILNFQIRLNTATGEVKFVYGTCMQGTGTLGPKVAWKSYGNNSSTALNSLQQDQLGSPSSCDWSNAVTGYGLSVSSPAMYFNAFHSAIKPNPGLTYTWAPQNAVSPVFAFAPVTAITGNSATLTWTAPAGATQYNVQYRFAGTSCNWTNWSGNPLSTTSVTLTGLLQNTKYQVRIQALNGINHTIYSYIPGATGNGYTQNGTFSTIIVPCTGIPNPGSTLVSNATPCSGSPVTFSLQNIATLGSGVSYQWYNNGGPIAGATNQTLVQTISAADIYHCDVTCGGNTGSSNPVAVTLNYFYNCTCASASINPGNEDIYQVTIAGASVNPIYTNGNGCSTPAPGPGSLLHRYSNFKTLGSLTNVTQGNLIPFEIRENECSGYPYNANGIAMWIDYNHNGSFIDPGEEIYFEPTTSSCTGPSPGGDKIVSGSFIVPLTALTGQTAMRIICADGIAGSSLTPCLSYNYGETEDYLINITPALTCSGNPNPGNTLASTILACSGSTVNFSLQNLTPGTGVSYQWHNNAGLVSGATASTYSQVISAADHIYCDVSCSGGPVVSSNQVFVSMNTFLNCYCVPNTQFGTIGGYYGWVSNVNFGSISNLSSFPAASPFYTNYSPSAATTANVIPGNSYTLSVVVNSGYTKAAVWFDWNQNGIFDTSEYTFLGVDSSSVFPFTFSQLITVPVGIPAGQIKMRIRSQNYGFGLNSTNACSLLEYGESEDYVITVSSSLLCSGNPNPGNTLASSTLACYGSTVNFSLQNQTPGVGVVYQWHNDTGSVVGSGPYYSQVMTAADHIYCVVKCAFGSVLVASNTVFVNIDTSSACFCIPNTQFGTSSGNNAWISDVEFGSISNTSSFPVAPPYYTNYPPASGTTADVLQGNPYILNVTVNSGFTQIAVWFDWDQNGLFDTSEYTFLGINSSSALPTTFSQVIYVPVNALAGLTKMRIRSQNTSSPLNPSDACSLLQYGESEDYTITVNALAQCTTFLGGYFTINQTIPSGGNNFSSFTDAVNALSCGISSPVTFSVVPGTGPYYEQVHIPEIAGASAINTITFLGNNEELMYQATSSNAVYTALLDGADYFRFNDLKVTSTSTTYPFGTVCQLTNGADNNIFTNCIFSEPLSVTNNAQLPFSIIIAAASGLSGSNNLLTACTISGGAYVTLQGNGSSTGIANMIVNNNILNIVGISMSGQNGAIISGNTIERTLSSFTVGGTGCSIGTGCTNTLVEKNKIRNFYAPCPACGIFGTGNTTGINVTAAATVGNENILSNNLISDMHKTNAGLVGINIGNNATFVKVYHNTISFDDTTTGGSSLGTVGISCNANLVNVDIRNNLVSVRRTGLAAKYCVNIQSGTAITCDNNNWYMNATGGTANYIGGAYPTLAGWQGANGSLWDQQSMSVNPGFTNPTIYDYHPTNTLIDNIGTNVGIATDITGTPRSTTTPDPGCYEFTVYPIDIGVSSFVSPDSNGCYSASQPIIVAIKNYGFSTINFGLNPATISCNVSGVVTSNLTTILASGTLSSGATLNVTLPPLNMAVNGIYTFTPYATIAGDTNSINNTLLSPVTRTVGPISGTITSVPSSICVSGTPTFTLHGNYGGAIQWQQSSLSAAGPWTNIGVGASTYTPSLPVTQTTWYRVQISCNGNTTFSATYTLTVNNPQVVSTVNGTRCGYGPVTLSAAGSSGSILHWYNNATDNIPVSTGNSFTTPNINTSTNFYVAAMTGTPVTPMNLFTTTVSNNITSGNLFDVNILNPVRIDSFAVKASAPGVQIQLYYRVGTGTGFNLSSAGWNFIGSASINSITPPLTVIPLNVNLSLQPGVYSFAMVASYPSIHALFGNNLASVVASDSNVQIMEGYSGISLTSAFTFNYGSIWNGRLYYSTLACESPKTAVTATVNTSPAILVTTANPTLCPGSSTTVSVTSPINPNYTYSWTSNPAGFAATGVGPFTINPTATTTYSVTAIDNSSGIYSGCGNVSSVSVITGASLSAGTVSSSVDTICTSGIPALTVTGASGGAIQWQSSSISATGPWTNVGSGLTTYIPSLPVTQTTYYRVLVSCQSTILISNVSAVVVTYPSATILTTTPGALCTTLGIAGTTVLGATSSGNSIPQWYNTPTGGTLLGAGNSFTTPAISTTTNFYVSALPGLGGASATATMPPEFSVHPAVVHTQGYWFTSPISFNITGVKVPSTGVLTGSSQSIAIVRFNGNVPLPMGNWTNAFTTLFLTQNNTNIGTIPCNVSIAAGDLIGILGQRSNISSEAAPGYGNPIPVAIAGTSVDFYPMIMNWGLSTNPPMDLADFNTGSVSSRMGRVEFEYNTGGLCDEIRTPVTATVIQAPPVTLTNSNPVICTGSSSVLTVSSPNDPNYTYVWYPGPFFGSTVTVSPTVSTVYYLYAVDNTTGNFATCMGQATTTVTVNPAPATMTTTASSPVICQGDNSILSVSQPQNPPYCSAGSTTNGCGTALPGYYISNVHFGSINNNSTCASINNYQDFTSLSTTVISGSAYAISVTVPVIYSPQFLIWIDYNHDGYFDISERTILSSTGFQNGSTGSANGTIVIPLYALNGPTRMRIRLSNVLAYYTYEDPCGYALYGEVEDYTVNITGGLNQFTWSPGSYLSSTIGSSVNAVGLAATTTYIVTATTSEGCTKTASATITVKPTSSSVTSASSCAPSYLWNGTTYSVSGSYTHTYINAVGCDSVAILNLVILPPCSAVNLTCLIEGYYSGSSTMNSVLLNEGEPTTSGACDTIEVELHDANSPYVLIASTKTILNQNGIATCTFPPLAGYYYIAVRHRNALQTWSANPLFIGSSGATYNFTTAANKAYGSNQKEVQPGVWAFYSGDIYPDENIDLLDLNMLENDIMSFQFGYFATDINGDGNIDLLDSPVLESNINNFIFSNHP